VKSRNHILENFLNFPSKKYQFHICTFHHNAPDLKLVFTITMPPHLTEIERKNSAVRHEKTVYNVLSLMYKETPPEQVQQGTTPPMAFRQYAVRNSKQGDKNIAEATDCS
jgi:hypothetical protein